MIWFTADEHYGHKNCIKYCNRPFNNLEEMNHEIICKNNTLVKEKDTVWHLGDFTLKSKTYAEEILKQLNGIHYFIRGSHDKWLKNTRPYIKELKYNNQLIVLSHYCMRVWPLSHYNSYHLFGHSHGQLETLGKSYDVGVDNNDFYPISIDKIFDIMDNKPNNFNFIEKEKNDTSKI